MNTKSSRGVVTLCVALVVGTLLYSLLFRSGGSLSRAAVPSPAPDMPASWFWHSDEESVKQHAELVGTPMPSIEGLSWVQAKPDSLEGRIVVLDIWATWCGPCIRAMPKTDALHQKYVDKGVTVMAVCSDGDREAVDKLIAEQKLTLPMAWDEGGAFAKLMRTQWFPTYAIIDRKGNIRAIGLGTEKVEAAIEKLLGES